MDTVRSTGSAGTLAGALLLAARSRSGLTQTELAKRAGVVRPLISQYETGKKDPSVSMLARLLQACGMELRLQASPLTAADRDQYERDESVGLEGARRNADRARRATVSVRRPSTEEVASLRRAARARLGPDDSDLRAVPILAALERHQVAYVLIGSYGDMDVLLRPAGFPGGYDDLIDDIVIVKLVDDADPRL